MRRVLKYWPDRYQFLLVLTDFLSPYLRKYFNTLFRIKINKFHKVLDIFYHKLITIYLIIFMVTFNFKISTLKILKPFRHSNYISVHIWKMSLKGVNRVPCYLFIFFESLQIRNVAIINCRLISLSTKLMLPHVLADY